MLINFSFNKEQYGEYCLNCHSQDLIRHESDYICNACTQSHKRAIIIDPEIKWWLGDNNEYFHESVGILLINDNGQILTFQLTKYPFGYTIPAGHVDKNEQPINAIIREAIEETGIRIKETKTIVKRVTIHGDSCRRGSDGHVWSLFAAKVTPEQETLATIDQDEGSHAAWMSLDEFVQQDLPFAMRYLLDNHYQQIERVLKTSSTTS